MRPLTIDDRDYETRLGRFERRQSDSFGSESCGESTQHIIYDSQRVYVHKHCIASPASYIDRGGEMGGGHISASSKAAELKRKTRQAHARLFIPQLFGSAIAPVLARKACVPSQIEGGKKGRPLKKGKKRKESNVEGRRTKEKTRPRRI